MRSLAFTATDKAYWNQWAALCCACGLCTLFACPEELFPKEACDDSKAEMRKAGVDVGLVRRRHPLPVDLRGLRFGVAWPTRLAYSCCAAAKASGRRSV
jgi:hypothetical protein